MQIHKSKQEITKILSIRLQNNEQRVSEELKNFCFGRNTTYRYKKHLSKNRSSGNRCRNECNRRGRTWKVENINHRRNLGTNEKKKSQTKSLKVLIWIELFAVNVMRIRKIWRVEKCTEIEYSKKPIRTTRFHFGRKNIKK